MNKIRHTLSTALLAALAITATAATAETLKLATNLPVGHSIVKFGIAPWMACVKERSKGELDFNFFPGGQIATAAASLDAINKGLVDLSMIVPSVLSDKIPLTGISMLPDMGDTSVEQVKAFRKVLDAGGPLADEFAANKAKVLLTAMLPPYQLVTKGAPLQTLDQMKGKKIRVAGGIMGLTVRSVGAVPVDIPAGDAYMAIQQGTADGAVFALSSVNSYKLQEIAKSMSGNGSFGASPAIVAMDTGVWAKLSPAKQAIFNDCTTKHDLELNQAMDQENEDLKKQFAAAGVTIYNFSPPVLAELRKRMEPVNKEYVTRIGARGVKSQEVYDAYRKALGK